MKIWTEYPSADEALEMAERAWQLTRDALRQEYSRDFVEGLEWRFRSVFVEMFALEALRPVERALSWLKEGSE